LTSLQIKARIDATYKEVVSQTSQNQDRFVWTTIKSPDELGQIRMAAMQDFLEDYERGKKEGRYLAAELPDIPFAPSSFDLAVCSHLLFLYSDHLSFAFHEQAIEAMCRAAREVRIFPILTYNAEPSPFVEPLIERLAKAGYQIGIEHVPYEFQRNGNLMMKVAR
jgi:hypothetical protein